MYPHRRPVHGFGFVFPSDRCPHTGDRAEFVGEIEFRVWVRLVIFMVQGLALAVFGPVDFWALRRLASNFARVKRTFAHIREFERIICIQFPFLDLCSSTKSNFARSHPNRMAWARRFRGGGSTAPGWSWGGDRFCHYRSGS